METNSRFPNRSLLPVGATALVAVASFALASQASAQVLFTENFNDGDASTRWTSAQNGGVNAVNFAFDYGAAGIPAAPRGTGSTGLRFDTNVGPTGTISSILAFPTGQSFSGPHVLSFDLWLNFVPLTTGTTEHAIFGVNHTSTAGQTPTGLTPGIGPSNNGIDYTMTGDNGAARDVRVYINGAEQVGTPGGFAGGTAQGTQVAPYTAAYAGTTPGNQWLAIDVWVMNDRTVLWVNGQQWAQTMTTTGPGNIMLGYMDLFGGSVAPNTTFALYDNVLVTVPEPSTYAAIFGGLALLGAFVYRRRLNARK